MTRFLFILLFVTLSLFNVIGQDFSAYLKGNAVKIDKLDSLSSNIYDLISCYRLIMVGEMHGTNEPAKFVNGLAELLTSHGDSVQVGFEIPNDQMNAFTKHPSDSSILYSDFFSKKSIDGRASYAWMESISNLTRNSKVKIFFYDVNNGECKNYEDRDSIMYLKIKMQIKRYSNWKTITLSGNIHNMLLPYKGKCKIANFLIRDKELKISDKLCSLNHFYQCGTILSNFGKGLELRQVDNGVSVYSNSLDYENYFLIFDFNTSNYSGMFFTKEVTCSKLIKDH